MSIYISRPVLLDKIPLEEHTVIEASAGTGKTYTIEHIVVDLIVRERVPLSEILVLTFTERAAAELRKRIRSKIESMLQVTEDGSKGVSKSRKGAWLIDQTARENLSRALYSFDGASIGTIHGFFGRVLTEHAFAHARLFEGALTDGRELFGRAFKTALRQSLACRPSDAADLLALWLEQRSGGIEKLEALLWTCHSSRRRILPSFSINVMRHEIENNPLFVIDLASQSESFKAALKSANVHASTIKSKIQRISLVANRIKTSGRSWQILLDDEFQDDVSVIAKDLNKYNLTDAWARQLADAFLHLADSLVCLEAAIVQTSLPIVQDLLERHKAMTGEFDYDDQIKGVAAAVEGAHGSELIRAMRGRYRFALIDEFQDTDELQWSFLERVFVESAGRNLVHLIGDPKQAIYGFRGADVQTYLKARDRVAQAGTPPIVLMENFRSTRDLIDAYNHILDPSADPPFLDGEIGYNQPVAPGQELVVERASGQPATSVHLLKIEQADGDSLSTAELKRGLARQIAREVRDLLSDEKGLWFGPKGMTKQIAPGDIYVLTATNKESVQVSQALREIEVPFAFYKQEGLFQTDQAQAVHDLLAAIVDPADADKRSRAWITPFFAVPLEALPDLDELPDSHPLIKRLMDWNELAGRRRFETLFTRILDETGVIRRERFLKDDERALTNYLHIFEVLLEESRTIGRDLADLVAMLTAYIQQLRKPPGEDGNIQRLESDRAAVQIMTIHKSKGLEAAVVFLYGGFGRFRGSGTYEYHDQGQRVLYIGDNDDAKKKAADDRCREEERLYYVALTRAKARLYLPLVPVKLGGKKWEGPYGRLNERLRVVASNLEESPHRNLFRVVEFQDRSLQPQHDDLSGAGNDPATWQPERELLKTRDRSRIFTHYRRSHAGYIVSSYSRMKRAWSGELDPLQRDEFRREPVAKTVATVLDDHDLPGGTASGTMLHEVLEKIPFDSLRAAPSLEQWVRLETVVKVFDTAMARNGIGATANQRRQAEEMIYRALTIRLQFDDQRSIPGLWQCGNIITEMEFLFPFPQENHPALTERERGKLVIEKGFIKGFVDLVVEHDGRVYFADWKSDVLPSYAPKMIAEHVDAHYNTQVQLYSLALVKALRIQTEAEYERLIGGLFYVFLRALPQASDEAQGIYYRKMTWPDILQYEAKLKRDDPRAEGGSA